MNKGMIWLVLVLIFLTGCFGGSQSSTTSNKKSVTIKGTVLERHSALPLEGIMIKATQEDKVAYSNSDGTFRLDLITDQLRLDLNFTSREIDLYPKQVRVTIDQESNIYDLGVIELEPKPENTLFVYGQVQYGKNTQISSNRITYQSLATPLNTTSNVPEPSELMIPIDNLKPEEIAQIISELALKDYELDNYLKLIILPIPEGTSLEEYRKVLQDHPLVNRVLVNNPITSFNTQVKWIPNVQNWDRQWNMQAVYLPYAWGLTIGNRSVKIAVLDTGMDVEHPELKPNVDMANRYNAMDKNDDVSESPFSHGTHVAGIIGAQAKYRVAGAMWNVTMVPIKVLGANTGNEAALARGIKYATDLGVDVINLSLGASSPLPTVKKEIDEAVAKGIVVVAAGGNDGASKLQYPAAYDNVLAVGAINRNYAIPSYSARDGIRIFAPGGASNGLIYSTDSRGPKSDGYAYAQGTSMATPLVSGLIGLLKAHKPELVDPDTIEELLWDTGMYISHPDSGYRVVNAHALLTGSYIDDTVLRVRSKDGEFEQDFYYAVEEREFVLALPSGEYVLESHIDTNDNDQVDPGEWWATQEFELLEDGTLLNVSLTIRE